MSSLQTWIVEVLIKKLGPSAIRGGILGIMGWIMTRNGMLAQFGVVSDMATHTTTIHWDTLSTWLIAGLPAITAAGIKLFQHHTGAVITGTPQSGDMRKNPPESVVGGERKEDIKGDN